MMKKLTSTLLLLASLSSFATDDFARITCSAKIEGNETEWKHRALRKSEISDIFQNDGRSNEFIDGAPGSPVFLKLRRIFPMPIESNFENMEEFSQAELESLDDNRVVLFQNDGDTVAKARKGKIGKVEIQELPIDQRYSVKIKYRAAGTSRDHKGSVIVGPRIIVHTSDTKGGAKAKVFGFGDSDEIDFKMKGIVAFDYTEIDQSGFLWFAEYEETNVKNVHQSEIIVKCQAKRVADAVDTSEKARHDGSEAKSEEAYEYRRPKDLRRTRRVTIE